MGKRCRTSRHFRDSIVLPLVTTGVAGPIVLCVRPGFLSRFDIEASKNNVPGITTWAEDGMINVVRRTWRRFTSGKATKRRDRELRLEFHHLDLNTIFVASLVVFHALEVFGAR